MIGLMNSSHERIVIQLGAFLSARMGSFSVGEEGGACATSITMIPFPSLIIWCRLWIYKYIPRRLCIQYFNHTVKAVNANVGQLKVALLSFLDLRILPMSGSSHWASYITLLMWLKYWHWVRWLISSTEEARRKRKRKTGVAVLLLFPSPRGQKGGGGAPMGWKTPPEAVAVTLMWRGCCTAH